MDLRMRPALPADAAVITEFNALMAEETEGLSLDRVRLRAGVDAIFADPHRGVYYVALDGETIVGQLMITYEWSDWRNGTFWWIQSVYTRKEYRGKGVFRALYRSVEQLARTRADVCGLRLYVEDHNTRAQQTYSALGMRQSKYRMMEVDFVL